MSTMQKLTLIGIYNYDPSLFDALSLPQDYDKDTFIDSLLTEHGEKCVLYSDPDFMKYSIGAWGRKWALELERIAQALKAEYDPIYNYDRYEEYSDSEGRKHESKTNAGHKAQDNPDYSIVNDTNENATTEHTISADNSGSYQPEWKETQNGGKTTAKTSGKTQDLSETSNSTTNDSETSNFSHKSHLYGNIGVTTSAQMVTEVVQQRYRYNLYATAAKLFANDLLIGIF